MHKRNFSSVGGGKGIFHTIISVSNLFAAWNEFKKGKRKKKDIARFEYFLEDNIFALHEELAAKKYSHEAYMDFYVHDPKRRHIHKASVRDRVLYQAVFRILYPLFDRHFIDDSYSSRIYKGTHAGVMRLMVACRKATHNWKAPVYVLTCDIKKFFDSVDHAVLRILISKHVFDFEALELIDSILLSFEKEKGKGLPLGNVTSQLFANVYLNELDQFVKHTVKAKQYFRYSDDFVIVHQRREFLTQSMLRVKKFLRDALSLELHPNKIEIRKIKQGIDFLGYVILPHIILLRTRTKRRIFKKMQKRVLEYKRGLISRQNYEQSFQSYVGIFSHANENMLRSKFIHEFQLL